jgi:hypothetical protein
MVNRGFADPRRSAPGQTHLDKVFTDSFTFWKDLDPAPKPQQGIPNSTIRWIANAFGHVTRIRLQVIADLVVVAYFFSSACANTQNQTAKLGPSRCDEKTSNCGGKVTFYNILPRYLSCYKQLAPRLIYKIRKTEYVAVWCTILHRATQTLIQSNP